MKFEYANNIATQAGETAVHITSEIYLWNSQTSSFNLKITLAKYPGG